MREADVVDLQLVEVSGPNVLAFQGLNVEANNPDFLLHFELTGSVLEVNTSRIGHFLVPTPGEPNSTRLAPNVATPPGYSRDGGTFTGDLTLELTTDVPGGVVHYTLDRKVPTVSSEIFDPSFGISLTETTQVRSIVVAPGYLPSPLVTQTYLKLADDLLDFRSQLPLVVVDNFGEGQYDQRFFRNSYWAIFEPGDADGHSSLLSAPDLQTRAGLKRRGATSVNQPKEPYVVEAWDEKDQDKDISPLGLAADADWIMSARFLHDRALMRPDFGFELSNQMGRYAVRTRFIEVFVNTNNQEVSRSDYVGVYSLFEKIKRGNDRVDVEKLSRNYITEPLITGGYMVKFDKPSPDDNGFNIQNKIFEYVDPKEIEITQPGREPQVEYIGGYLNDLALSLTNPDPLTGYPAFMDVDAWVDIHLLEIFLTDSDGFENSLYYFKRRGGRIEPGPIWDLDRTVGWDGCGLNVCSPERWAPQGFTGERSLPWYGTLLADPDYRQRFIDRYQELREVVFRADNLSSILAFLAAQITVDAAERNFARWGPQPNDGNPPSWLGEVEFMQQWLEDRVNWIDDQLIPKPILMPSEGVYLGGAIQLGGPLPPGSLAFDFGPSDSPVSDGYTGVGDQPFDNNIGYG